MNVTRDEAVEALATIEKAGGKVGRLKGYHHGAPHFVIWGLVWLVGNTATDLAPQWGGYAWLGSLVFGFVGTFLVGYRSARGRTSTPADPRKRRYVLRFVALGVVFFLFFLSMSRIVQIENARQGGTLVSIIFPFLYMGAGVWMGWRLFAIGAVTAAAIMAGYVWVDDHYFLYMGVVGGGSLIAGGLWLRSA